MSNPGYGKFSKHRIMSQSTEISQALPETHKMNMDVFWRMLGKYGKVIIKPTGAYGGSGVIQVAQNGKGKYAVHFESVVRHFNSKAALGDFIHGRASKGCIVQRRIALARVDGRPFDLRVMVQRKNTSSAWIVTGKLAKVAGKGFIVTNIKRSHGKVTTVESAIARAKLSAKKADLVGKIDKLALQTATHLGQHYRNLRTVGLDLGIDRNGKVWIIEANFLPMLALFNYLKDKTMYRRICSYKKAKLSAQAAPVVEAEQPQRVQRHVETERPQRIQRNATSPPAAQKQPVRRFVIRDPSLFQRINKQMIDPSKIRRTVQMPLKSKQAEEQQALKPVQPINQASRSVNETLRPEREAAKSQAERLSKPALPEFRQAEHLSSKQTEHASQKAAEHRSKLWNKTVGQPAKSTGAPAKSTGTSAKSSGAPARSTGAPAKSAGVPAKSAGAPAQAADSTAAPESQTF